MRRSRSRKKGQPPGQCIGPQRLSAQAEGAIYKLGRSLTHSPEERYLDRMRADCKPWPYGMALLRKREVWAKPLFAEAKECNGMRRFRSRRLRKVNMEAFRSPLGRA